VLFSFGITTKVNEFLVDNIFALFGWCVFEQTVGNYVGTDCVPLLADLFVYSYETELIQGLVRKNEKKLARSFNFTFRYIDDVFSLNNCRFSDFVNSIYPIELEIKDTTDIAMFASYFDIHLAIDSEDKLRTTFYDKRDNFKFPIMIYM
jgi:hypothetical protein